MLQLLLSMWVIGHGADLGATRVCVNRGTCQEAWLPSNPGAMAAVKVGVAAYGLYQIPKSYKQHPKRTIAVVVGVTLFNGYLAHRALTMEVRR